MKTQIIKQAIISIALSALSLSAIAADTAGEARLQQLLSVGSSCSPAHSKCVTECMQNPSPWGKVSCIQSCPAC